MSLKRALLYICFKYIWYGFIHPPNSVCSFPLIITILSHRAMCSPLDVSSLFSSFFFFNSGRTLHLPHRPISRLYIRGHSTLCSSITNAIYLNKKIFFKFFFQFYFYFLNLQNVKSIAFFLSCQPQETISEVRIVVQQQRKGLWKKSGSSGKDKTRERVSSSRRNETIRGS